MRRILFVALFALACATLACVSAPAPAQCSAGCGVCTQPMDVPTVGNIRERLTVRGEGVIAERPAAKGVVARAERTRAVAARCGHRFRSFFHRRKGE